MSRSYKKTPIIKENSKSGNKARKQQANVSLRMKLKQGEDIGQNKEYQKHYDSYEINEYYFRMTKEEAIAKYNQLTDRNSALYDEWFANKYQTLESFLNWWEKHYFRK